MDFGCFSAAVFAKCQSRLARNEITENIKNMQITAEICKHQAQEKKYQNTDRDTASCSMQTAAQSADLQIRGRRCSRRMAHSDPPPPSRRAGLEGVSNTSADFCRLQSLRYPPTGALSLPICRPSDSKSQILGRFFADRKFI